MAENPALDPDREYYLFAGYLVTSYARVEQTLRGALKKKATISDEQFLILVGAPRSGDLVTKVRKLAAVHDLNDEERAIVEDAFEQLAEITKLRDRVVHYGSIALSRGRTMVLKKGISPTGLTHDETQIDNLWNAAKDLNLINLIFLLRLNPEAAGIPPGETPWNAVRNEPWQYKPL